MVYIISKKYCFDNMKNRIKIMAKLSNNSTLVVFKTPIYGGPYAYYSYTIPNSDLNRNDINVYA